MLALKANTKIPLQKNVLISNLRFPCYCLFGFIQCVRVCLRATVVVVDWQQHQAVNSQ